MTPGPTPREQVETFTADARRDFATDVDILLHEVRVCFETLDANDHARREEALRSLRRSVLARFDRRRALTSTADPVLLQLVREAYALFNSPDSPLQLQDWNREAEKWLAP